MARTVYLARKLSVTFALFVSILLAPGQARADILQVTTDAGSPIPTWEIKTKTINGTNVSAIYQYDYVLNPLTSQKQWRTVGIVPTSEYTQQQKNMINNLIVQQYGAVVLADPTKGGDCHGYTFKSPTVGILGKSVPTILQEQGYGKPIAERDAAVGDVVVYKNNNVITHTGIIAAVNNGKITLVDSKWGAFGVYEHAPNKVLPIYGSVSAIYSAKNAKLLKDPGSDDDLGDFAKIPLVSAKPQLFSAGVNDYPGATLALLDHHAGNWQYALDAPLMGLFLRPGDTITLYAAGIDNAFVSGAAGAFPWEISYGDDYATWRYEGQPLDLNESLEGFEVQSHLDAVDDAYYRETVNGSIGRTYGPGPVVPEPSTLMLLSFGAIGLVVYGRRHNGTQSAVIEA